MNTRIALFAALALSMPWAANAQLTPPAVLQGTNVLNGKAESLEIASSPKGTVIVFLSAICPCSASHEIALQRLHAEYGSKGFRFLGVHSNSDEPIDLTRAHFEKASLPFPVLEDRSFALANVFGALKTPHAYIVDSKGEVLFQGGVDDSNDHSRAKKHYLREALAAISAGKEPEIKNARTLGCVIKRQ